MGNKESKEASSQTKITENVEPTAGVESKETVPKVSGPKEEVESKEGATFKEGTDAGTEGTGSN